MNFSYIVVVMIFWFVLVFCVLYGFLVIVFGMVLVFGFVEWFFIVDCSVEIQCILVEVRMWFVDCEIFVEVEFFIGLVEEYVFVQDWLQVLLCDYIVVSFIFDFLD